MNTEQPSTQPTSVQRKSKPREEDEFLKYATTPRGAYRLKKLHRMMKKQKL